MFAGFVEQVSGSNADHFRTAAEEAETVSTATQEQTASVHEIADESTNFARMAGELRQDVEEFNL